ncbi:hypothetical protein HDZ31DRAFT_28296 [Schizophyllum fasciatum]
MASLLFAHSSRRRSQSASPSGHHTSGKNADFWPSTLGQERRGDRSDMASDKWNVDSWRKGTKRKQGLSSPTADLGASSPTLAPSGRFSRPTFATTAADFQLSSSCGPSLSSRPRKRMNGLSAQERECEMLSEPDISRLHSEAFSDLNRSITESNERFVQRMRELEHEQPVPQPDYTPRVLEARHRGRKRACNMPSQHAPAADPSDDDDDVLVYSGERADPFGGNPRRKRLRATSREGSPAISPGRNSGYSSPSAPSCDSASSASPSDDDEEDEIEIDVGTSCSLVPGLSSVPVLSSAETNSSASSMRSSPPAECLPLPSTRSEKALAALTLAMEHGIGVADYAALRVISEGEVDPYNNNYWG